MRFAWLRENAGGDAAQAGILGRLVLIAYNLVWWLPIVLGFARVIDYRAAFITFFAITAIRAIANLIRNHFLSLEQAETFPFRSP